MKRTLIYMLLMLLFFLPLEAQNLQLMAGESYLLHQFYNQDTHTESMGQSTNVSLDIECNLHVEILAVNDSGVYDLKCHYQDADLSMFSSDLDIRISTQTRSVSMIMKYTDMLENYSFRAKLSPLGELFGIENLDNHIYGFYSVEEEKKKEQDLIIKTLQEAFGEDALVSFFNLTLNVYCPGKEERCIKEVPYSFNAKPVDMRNTFYRQKDKEGKRRIQGIGSIETGEEAIEFEEGRILTSLSGNQTYDLLFDASSGWLLEGVSRQKIFLKSVFQGVLNMPDGLEVPSYTETEFRFTGTKLEKE